MTTTERVFGTLVIAAAIPIMAALALLAVVCEAAVNLYDLWW